MRNVRIVIVIFFSVVAVFFAVNYIRERLNTDYYAPIIQADSDTLSVSVKATRNCWPVSQPRTTWTAT